MSKMKISKMLLNCFLFFCDSSPTNCLKFRDCWDEQISHNDDWLPQKFYDLNSTVCQNISAHSNETCFLVHYSFVTRKISTCMKPTE